MVNLTQLSFLISLGWAMSKENPGFTDSEQGPGSRYFTLGGIDLTVFNKVWVEDFEVDAGNFVDIDLQDLTDLLYEQFAFNKVLAIGMIVTDLDQTSMCNLSPSPSDGLQWFFGGASDSINIPPGGAFALSGSKSLPGGTAGPEATPVTPTEKNIRVSNTGAETVSMIIFGGNT